MTRITRIQPAARIDNVLDDGTPLYQLPYPFYVTDDGKIGNQDFWQGHVAKVIGFQDDLAVMSIDLFWREAVADPTKAVGKYVVTSDAAGNWAVHDTAIESVSTFTEGESYG